MPRKLRAVVALAELCGNPYFSARAAELFAETVYLPTRPGPIQLKNAMDEFDVVIVGARERITADLLTDATQAQIVGTLSIGTDHLDLTALEQRNIKIFNSPTANTQAVAEHNLALAFGLAKRLKEGDLSIQHGAGRAGLSSSTFELGGKTLGVIGYGKIGKTTARLFAAIGAHVIATSRTRTEGEDGDIQFVPLATLLTAAQIVVLAVPLTSATRGLLDAAALDSLSRGALVINTCRPDMVDHTYLRRLLDSGHLAGFGADYDEDVAGLAALPNCLITPHIAGLTAEANNRIDNDLIDGIAQFLDEQTTS
jgi:(S)-sulfolactate dehydrogenase